MLLATGAAHASLIDRDITIGKAITFGGLYQPEPVTVVAGSPEISCPDPTVSICTTGSEMLGSGGGVDVEASSVTVSMGNLAAPFTWGDPFFGPFHGFVFLDLSSEPLATIKDISVTTDVTGLDASDVVVGPDFTGLDPALLNLGVNLDGLTVDPGESFTVDFVITHPFIAYRETFVGESTFPTSPEQDAITAGGLDADAGVTLDGTGAHFVANEGLPTSLQLVSLGAGGVGARDFELRVEFDDYSFTSPMGLENPGVAVYATFDDGSAFAFGVSPENDSYSLSRPVPPLEVSGFDHTTIPAIAGGAPFTLSMWFDRTADEVYGRIDIPGVGSHMLGPLNGGGGVGLGSASPVATAAGVFFPSDPPDDAVVTVDMTEFEVLLRPSEKVPAAGVAARGVLALLCLTLGAARLCRRGRGAASAASW